MGDNIDTPFVNLKQILIYRHNYGLQRAYRKIRNPFPGKHLTENGETVIIKNDGNGFYCDLIPNMQIIQTENGPIGKLTMAERFMDSEEDMIKKYSKIFESKTGLPVSSYKLEKSLTSMPISVTITDRNNDFIFGCLKIAYETAVTCIPKYYNDELAIAYSKMLETGVLNKSFAEFLNPKTHHFEQLIYRLNTESTLNKFDCTIALSNVDTLGLVAVIKIFKMTLYCLVLSKEKHYIDDRVILILNDSIQEQIGCNLVKKIASFELFFNNQSLLPNHWLEIEKNSKSVAEIFLNEKREVAIYSNTGEVIAEHITALHSASTWQIDFFGLSTIQKFNLKLSEGFFIKSLESGLLYELSQVNFNY